MVMCKCGEYVSFLDDKEYEVCSKCGEVHFNIKDSSVGCLDETIRGICPTLDCNKFTTFLPEKHSFFDGRLVKNDKLYSCPSCLQTYFGRTIRDYAQYYARGI